MNENVLATQSDAVNQTDAFMAGWDDTPITVETEAADHAEETTETETTDTPQENEADAETETETEAPDGVAENQGVQAEETEAENTTETVEESAKQQWTLKLLGEEKTLTVDDITPELLQKGLDYERVRTKWEDAKPVMAMFSDFANKAGMTVPEYVKYIRAEAKKASGLSDEEANRVIELEDREAAVNAKEAEAQREAKAETDKKAKIDADLNEFKLAFPEVYEKAKSNPEEIPSSVWKAVNGGLSLTAAYARYSVEKANKAVTEAERKAATQMQNTKNAGRTTGSMKTAGEDTKTKDPFMAGFYG